MGHITASGNEYNILQQRLSQKVQNNPGTPTLMKILQLLFSPADAVLAGKLPHKLTPVTALARSLRIPLAELNDKLTEMAQRGLVFDMECNGRRYVTLPPVVIGLFEFVFMRARPDIPQAELAHLFEVYFTENDGAFAKSISQGRTQLARTFVQEEALPDGEQAEILDWERASHIVASATAIAVGMCQCQHLAQHLGTACAKPQEVCLSFNYAAESMVKNGLTRAVTKNEAMGILEKCKDANLIQIGDNFQRQVSFICNCCGCCCEMIRGLKAYNLNKGVVSSNWLMAVDDSRCKGCGECAKVCPVEAIRLEIREVAGRKQKLAIRAAEVCLGCGLCTKVCKSGGATMQARPRRVLAPETIFDQRVAMAIERGKLADMLFDDPEKLSHRALGRIMAAMEKTSPYQALMAAEAIKSAFLRVLVTGAKIQAGGLARFLT
jgi:ferredoxin